MQIFFFLALIIPNGAGSPLVPRGALSATGINLVSDGITGERPILQFGELDASRYKWELTHDGSLILSHGNTDNVFMTFKVEPHHQLILGDLLVTEGDLVVQGYPQWRLVRAEDFTAGTLQGWDNPRPDIVSECAAVPMLGGFGKFSKGEIAKSFVDLPSHRHLRIRATFHFIDRWNGETGFMRLDIGKDGSLVHVWTERHSQNTDRGVNICGSPVPDSKFSVPIDVVVPHSSPSIRVGFGSTMETDDSLDASWGVSSLELFVK